MQTFLVEIESHKNSQVYYLPICIEAKNFKDALDRIEDKLFPSIFSMDRIEDKLFPSIFSNGGFGIGEVKIKHIPHMIKD